ncbi:hypothetical protein S40288_09586 [Stachybotrys chartarum IBT 40288]|nr:hypothetical protein S40288_09586 [Stachybotrys chartarum IBT 40288]
MARVNIGVMSDDGFNVVDANLAEPEAVNDVDCPAQSQPHLRGQGQSVLPSQLPEPLVSQTHSGSVRHVQSNPSPSRNQPLPSIPLEDSDNSYDSGNSDSTSAVKRGNFIYDRVKSFFGWSKKDVVIAVMGMTGSGKTTFISKVTGRSDLKIGHDLTSCTRDIKAIDTKIGDTIVRFVDTPGFSDTNLSDTEVLEMIAEYLAMAYENNVKLSGIIYLHPISDNRVTHHAIKNLEMFRNLTGEKNLGNVVLTTSMWTAQVGFKNPVSTRRVVP